MVVKRHIANIAHSICRDVGTPFAMMNRLLVVWE